jgi:hypothetical protein
MDYLKAWTTFNLGSGFEFSTAHTVTMKDEADELKDDSPIASILLF